MSETKSQDWVHDLVVRAEGEKKPAPIQLPTNCSECTSTNIFHGSTSSKCKSCGHVMDRRRIESGLELPAELAEETKTFQRQWLKSLK